MYNSSIRDYIETFYDYKKSKTRYVVVSLLPFFVICLFSAVFPKLEDTISFFGYTVYNFNGYIVPFLMGIQTLKYSKKSSLVRISMYVGLIFFILLGLSCGVI